MNKRLEVEVWHSITIYVYGRKKHRKTKLYLKRIRDELGNWHYFKTTKHGSTIINRQEYEDLLKIDSDHEKDTFASLLKNQ